MTSVISIAAFFKRMLPGMFKENYCLNPKKREDFTNWISWNMGRYNVFCVNETDSEKIAACGIARSISSEEDARFAYKTDEQGKILYVHAAAAKRNDAFRYLFKLARTRWPQCDQIMFYRKKTKRRMIYEMNRFEQLLERTGK